MNFDALVYVDIDQGIYKGKTQSYLKWKPKKLLGFSFSINIANFEAFLSVKKLSANFFFLKSVTNEKCKQQAEPTGIFFLKLKILWKSSNKTLIKKQLLLKKISKWIFVSKFIYYFLWFQKNLLRGSNLSTSEWSVIPTSNVVVTFLYVGIYL